MRSLVLTEVRRLRPADWQTYRELRLLLHHLDSDGSKWAVADGTGRSHKACTSRMRSAHADAVPFFVLPRKQFYQEFGIQLGDIAAVIIKTRSNTPCSTA